MLISAMKKYFLSIIIYFSFFNLQAESIRLTHYLSPKSFFVSEEAEMVLMTQKMINTSETTKELALSFGTAIKKYEKKMGRDFSFTEIDDVYFRGLETTAVIAKEKVFKFPSRLGWLDQWNDLIKRNREILDSPVSDLFVPFKIIDNIDLSIIHFSHKLDKDNSAKDFLDSELYKDKEKVSIFVQERNDDNVEKYLAEYPQNQDAMFKAIISLQNSLLTHGYYVWDYSNNLVYKTMADGQLKVFVRDNGALITFDAEKVKQALKTTTNDIDLDDKEKKEASMIVRMAIIGLLQNWGIDNYELLKDQNEILEYLDSYPKGEEEEYSWTVKSILQAA